MRPTDHALGGPLPSPLPAGAPDLLAPLYAVVLHGGAGGGGGGGYSGGQGGYIAGGAGSYNAGLDPVGADGTNEGDGWVLIDLID